MGAGGSPYVYLLSLVLVMLAGISISILRQGGRSATMQIGRIDERLRVVEVSMTTLSSDMRSVSEASKRMERVLDGLVVGMLEDYGNRRAGRVDS